MSFSSSPSPMSPGTPGPDEIRLRLQRVLPSLAEFGSREEAQFMLIGRQLGDFLQRSRAISSSSDVVIDSLLRQEGEEILTALHALMDDLERHIASLFADARCHQDALRQVGVHIQRTNAPLQALVKIIKILHSLSFSTRVESTQGHSVIVLQTLADNLKGLATKIHSKTDAVHERLKIMWALAEGAKEKTQTMAEVSLRQAGNNLQQCRTVLGDVARRRSAALRQARCLQNDSANIATAINEIITSVQFHDITRQQVEHVQIALQDFCQRFCAEENAGIMAGEAADLCRIQSAQLRHTRHDLVTAVVRMITSLSSIAPTVQQLVQQTRILATSTEAVGASLLREVEPVLATVTSIIATADAEDRQAVASVAAVLDVLNELSQLLQEVESIGSEMKMISLNAGITAAHNFERGAGLGVIARSIQSLSSDVLSCTNEFAAVYGQMDKLAWELGSVSSAPVTPNATGTTQLNAAAATFLAQLQLMNQGGLQLLQTLDRDAMTLANDVVATANKITIHIDAGKIIDQLVAEFETIAGSIHNHTTLADQSKIIDLISQNYTMQSERRVHAEVRQSGIAVSEEVGSDLTGLGVNVELF